MVNYNNEEDRVIAVFFCLIQSRMQLIMITRDGAGLYHLTVHVKQTLFGFTIYVKTLNIVYLPNIAQFILKGKSRFEFTNAKKIILLNWILTHKRFLENEKS